MTENCSGCNPNLFTGGTSDKTITYTGDNIPALGICTGNSLNKIEGVVLQKLIDYSTGVGISIPDIDLSTCALFQQNLVCCTTCTDLPCLMQAYLTALCTLFGDITTLQELIDQLLNGPYNVGCLTLGSNPTLNQIIQELIIEFCALKAAVATLQTQVNNLVSNLSITIGNQILSALTTCSGVTNLVKTGTGATAAIAFNGFPPIGSIIPYGGPTAGLFGPTGAGNSGTPMCGWHLANGLDLTVDMREQVAVGAGSSAMLNGGALPVNASGANYPINALVGSATVTLNATQIPPATMTVTGTHTHDITGVTAMTSTTSISNTNYVIDICTPNSMCPGADINCGAQCNGGTHTFSGKISSSTASYTGTVYAGGGSPHGNIQPSRALLYIQRMF